MSCNKAIKVLTTSSSILTINSLASTLLFFLFQQPVLNRSLAGTAADIADAISQDAGMTLQVTMAGLAGWDEKNGRGFEEGRNEAKEGSLRGRGRGIDGRR